MRRPGPLAAALTGATIISWSAIVFRLSGAEAFTAGFFRVALAFPVLALLAGREPGVSWRNRMWGLAAGVFLGLDIAAWHTAIGMIGAGLGTLIANSQVVIVPLVTWLVLSERPSPAALTSMPVVLVGLGLITGLGRQDAYGSRPVLGVSLAVLAALFYSGFLIFYRRVGADRPAAGPLRDAVLTAALTLGLAAAVSGRLDLTPGWPAFGWLALLALGPQVVGWLLIGHALPRLPAAVTSFAILLQPALTLLWGRLVFDEEPSPLQITGVALVLIGIAAVSWSGRARKVAVETG